MNHPLKYYKVIILIILLSYYTFFLFQRIDLVTADLGRHLKNGEMILAKKIDVLNTNFYSYTYPNYPLINHHWLSGVIFFLIFKLIGFKGVHLFFIVLSLITFYIFFYLARKESGFKIASVLSILLIPLITQRAEVRPEVFSYFFAGLFFLILWKFRKGEISYKWLFILPFIQILWINLHIYFIFGLFLIGLFLLESLFFKDLRKNLFQIGVVLLLSILAILVNPFGIKGALIPFKIFENYGYKVVENQSVYFLIKWGFRSPHLLLFLVVFLILALSFIFVLIKNRKNFSLVYFLVFFTFGVMSWLAIRNFSIFALFALPVISYNTKNIFENIKGDKANQANLIMVICLAVFLLFSLINYWQTIKFHLKNFGLGLIPESNLSAEFFLKNNIKGPIFNNYDIGGYLIFYLFPEERVFTDNRPEAYPSFYFKEEYIPMQEKEEVWQKLNKHYNFNVIFFYWHEITPWGQNFLIKRINDPEWAPVFVDEKTIIFLKNNSQNRPIIKKYKILREYFQIVPST